MTEIIIFKFSYKIDFIQSIDIHGVMHTGVNALKLKKASQNIIDCFINECVNISQSVFDGVVDLVAYDNTTTLTFYYGDGDYSENKNAVRILI